MRISGQRDYSRWQVYAMIVGMSQSDQNTQKELHAVVVGLVQGVGFRYFVIQKAQSLGLHGYVRNDRSGNVDVVAQGKQPVLEQLLAFLHQGPSAAEVDDVQVEWREPSEHMSGFRIRW